MAHLAPRLAFTSTALALGLGALAFLPASHHDSTAAVADTPAQEVTTTAASQKLLQTLDAELAPPSPNSYALRAPATTASASVLSTAAEEPAATPDVSSLQPPQPTAVGSDSVGSVAVNLRSGPGGNVLSVLDAGAAVSVVESNGGWVHVHLDDGRDGWVYSTYLTGGGAAATGTSPPATPATPAAPAQTIAANAPRAVIQSDGGDLTNRTARFSSALPAYARPADSAPSIFTFQPGDEVRIAEVRGDWLEVEGDNGITAWIKR